MIRVELPYHLRLLARVDDEVRLEFDGPQTIRAALTELELRYPALNGTIWDKASGKRRPFIRFFVCSQDWSHDRLDTELPELVRAAAEPLLIVGAVAGG
ncbi:MAG: MoaD/ThiS family protein [Acidobacteria bacterium]|nr:MoaD/ThiS family protein [Acidobacteriota bacterium]